MSIYSSYSFIRRVVRKIRSLRSCSCEERCDAGPATSSVPTPTIAATVRHSWLPLASSASCELRSLIRFMCTNNTAPVDIPSKLCTVYEAKCMRVQRVRKVCREFIGGFTDVHEEERSVGHRFGAKQWWKMVDGSELCEMISARPALTTFWQTIQGMSRFVQAIPRMLTEHQK